MSNGMILTNAGRNILAKALTGKTLTFTKAMTGDGTLGSRNAASLTALISPKRELPIQSMSTTGSLGTCEVVLEMTNKGLTTGFFVREYGLFAKEPDTGVETLYSYCNKGSEAGYLEGDNGVDIINYTLSLVTVIDQASNVTAYITNSNQYVTISRLDQRMADLFADYASTSGFWTWERNNEQRLRPCTLRQAKQDILDGVDVANLNSRIERLEDALNQTLLELEVQSIFPGYTHYIVEDFKTVNQLDMFTSDVTSIVAGDDSIDCKPIDGMIPGSWYTITDGISMEQVQVESINLENGIQRIILTKPIVNTYLLENTQLYRTSANISADTALGPNARLRINWEPSLVWHGTGAQESFNVQLATDTNNARAFTLTNDAVLDTSGRVTLSA